MCDVNISGPRDVIKEFHKIKEAHSISISRCSLLEIPIWIRSLENLNILDLSSNSFESLDPLWESNLPSLHELNLSACWLRKLPFGIPTFANSLETLILDGNYLGESFPNFSVFHKLKTLSIIGNDFMNIPILPKNLQKLMFRLNTFSTIPDCTISVIDASYCKIRGKLTINAHQITSLDLSHCGLFGHISFPPLPLLDSLNLSNNSISSISFESSRRLTMLNLSYNAISEFPSFLFRFPMLRHLEISHNVIPGIPRDLSPLKRLEILDISHNQLITPRLLLPIKLQTLIASFNYSMAFEAFPSSLKHIDVSFCSTVVIPPISPSIEWIAVFFVSAIYINEKMKPLNDETHQKTADGMQSDLETALAPASLFRPSRVFRTNTNFLNIPTLINDKLSDHIGCSATSGHSTKYEDNFMSITIDDISYIGVFDGHAGHESAYISAETFSKLLGPIVGTVFDEDTHIVKKAMKRSFAMVNDELSRRAVKDGTTAVVMAVKGHRVVIGHVGDSLALLVRSNSAEWLTSPHRPYELIEYNRMKDQQKAVTPDWRVDGKLCVSRSLGDFWCCDGMYDKPDVEVKELPNDVVSVVMACDGLWDYIDIGAVANVVRKIKDPVKAAKLLQDYAFAAGSHDSISVIVVNFTDDI